MSNETSEKNTHIHNIIITLLLLLAIFLGLEVFSDHHQKPKAEAMHSKAPLPIINVTTLKGKNILVEKKYIGMVTPVHSASVLPFMGGFVEKIYVQSGQYVKKGTPLLILEQAQYKASLDLAFASINQAKANFENAASYYHRIKTAGSGAVSRAEKDEAKANFLTAKADLQKAKAEYMLAQVNYNYTILTAPISGVVGVVQPSKGDYVSPQGKPLLTIIQTSPIEVVFSMTDKEYLERVLKTNSSNLLKETEIKLQLSNGEIYPHQGYFKYIDNQLNKQTNSLAVYTGFPNKENILMSNSYVTVCLESVFKDAILIPQTFVHITPKGEFITLANKKEIFEKKVDILGEKEGNFILKNTFAPDEFLVLEKPRRMKKGEAFQLKISSSKKES